MKKGLFTIDQQDTKKRSCLRRLHELLKEQQEPFLLEDFLLDRRYSSRGLHGKPEDNLSGGATKTVLQQKKPKLTVPNALQYNRIESGIWASACYFLEMRLKQNKKRRRCTGMKTRRGNLNMPRRSEEYPAEECNFNEKPFECVLHHERKTAETEQLTPARYLNTDQGGISAQKDQGMFTRMFSLKKDKKTNKDRKDKKEYESEKTVERFWFQSILRKLAPSKEFGDPDGFSKRFWISVGRRKPMAKFYNNEPVQLRVSDIVDWNSFGESNDSTTPENGYVSLECTRTIADSMAKPRALESDPGDLQKSNEEISQEIVLGIKQNKLNLRAILKGINWVCLNLSSASSSTLFDSCLDSDIGSISMAMPSSSGILEDKMQVDSQLPKGIDSCGLEASCCSGHLSFDTDENGVKGFQHRPRHRVAQSPGSTASGSAVGNPHAQFGASNGNLRQDYMHRDSTLTGDLSILKLSDIKENPVNSSVHTRVDDWKSGRMSYSSLENEEKEKSTHSHCIAGTLWNENRVTHIHSYNLEHAAEIGFVQRSKQRRPVSVLDFNIAEGAAAVEQSATNMVKGYLAEGLNDRSMQAFTVCKLHSHAKRASSLECPRSRQLPRQAGSLLVDCVREVLELPREQYGSGLLTEAWLEECLDSEKLAKTISGQIWSWNKLDPSLVDNLLDRLLRKGEEEWTKFRGEAEEIATQIEVAIFGALLEELVLDLASLQP